MTRTTIHLETPDGSAPTQVFRPSGKGPWPAVLVFIDGIGMRPALYSIGERLAAEGYFTVMPDLFYRLGAYEAPEPKAMFTNPDVGKAWWGRVVPAAGVAQIMSDTQAYLGYIAGEPDAIHGKVGVTGYCMGGRMAVIAAGTFPGEVVAAAAYHPGGMATDAPDSPHLLAGKIRAELFIGAAKEDQSFPKEAQDKLAAALSAAHVKFQLVEFDAKHGWVPTDTPVHDAAEAEHHFQTLLALLGRTLK